MNIEQVRDLSIGLKRKISEYESLLSDCRAKYELWQALNQSYSDLKMPQIFSDSFLRTLGSMGLEFPDAVKIFGEGALNASCEADKKLINHPCHHPAKIGTESKR
jgi:hypothetical protein